ncbi:hypothetical protein SAMN05878503_10950 [Cereibacter ovatus]|uniref:Uncharacterized protein n=1 Tax=Cereibacter ovatus TaxID=439529 RepID=A0A285CUL0_9RHOB|nr:hypothetical protein SAMN05878503_10950 [Cereibacter ovatus]
MSLRRILRAVGGLDPVNFAPALLPDHARTGGPRAEISDEAWSFCMTTPRDAGPQFPHKQAWRDVARRWGWTWPKYITAWPRGNAVPEPQASVVRPRCARSMPITRDREP